MPKVNQPPRAHTQAFLEGVRNKLSDAATEAAGGSDKIDLDHVPEHLRGAVESIAGESLSAAALQQNLESALDSIERADIGGDHRVYRGYSSSVSKDQRSTDARHDANVEVEHDADIAQNPLAGRIRAMMGWGERVADSKLQVGERGNVEGTGDGAIDGLLAGADAVAHAGEVEQAAAKAAKEAEPSYQAGLARAEKRMNAALSTGNLREAVNVFPADIVDIQLDMMGREQFLVEALGIGSGLNDGRLARKLDSVSFDVSSATPFGDDGFSVQTRARMTNGDELKGTMLIDADGNPTSAVG